MTACDCKSAFAVRPSEPEAPSRKAEDRAVESAVKTQRFTARQPIDVTPELRGRIKVMTFQREQIARELPQRKEMGRMDDLTEVELYWHRGRVERWIRFGPFACERIIDRRRRVVGFSPGSIFAYRPLGGE